jgi:hypothetical protein
MLEDAIAESRHDVVTSSLEEKARRQPVPKWTLMVLVASAIATLFWIYWIATLVL